MNVTERSLSGSEAGDRPPTRDSLARLSGRQAIVQLALLRHRLDQSKGLKTAGFVTGYRGSPLGSVDQAFEDARQQIEQDDIRFMPGVNEDLAATAVLGTQQINLFPGGTRQGVFAMWYAKGPGVDRSGDALRHGNLAGSAPCGGVLLLAGDDHTCKSSTTSHQSEYALMDAMIPTLNPSGLHEVIGFGLFGWALSRYSGCWAAMKLTADSIDASALVDLDPIAFATTEPADFALPDAGLNIRWPDTPQDAERRLHKFKLPAAMAFARANCIDRIALLGQRRRLGIVTAGKSYHDVLQALEVLGISEARAAAAGLSIFKVGMVWPLEPEAILGFARGFDEILVVEEKRPLIEGQLKDLLYNLPATERPRIFGKRDADGRSLLPAHDDLSSLQVAWAVGARLAAWGGMSDVAERLARPSDLDGAGPTAAAPVLRTPYFCSGCPHSSSTKVPEGSRALAGIGCHWMAQAMGRNTATYTHMGGEGANWIGQAPFVEAPHVFQNMGDGTYFHSGLLAIRAALAARATITYKILFNDATAMTGGQRHDGVLSPQRISHQLRAEGVARIVVVADDPGKYRRQEPFASRVTIHPRRDLDAVQRDLREVKGVSALIYDQICAAEKRRRKQDVPPAAEKRIFINELVCEGCGDCAVKSNCLSVVPVETEFGRKRRIDQSSCNQDFSCVEGFCPSFVTVEGVKPRRSQKGNPDDIAAIRIPEPLARPSDPVWNVLAAGVGGTGVVTIGAILARAAMLEGKSCATFEMTGMAQKGGPVTSHIRFSEDRAAVQGARIPIAAADLILGCDLVVAAGKEAISLIGRGRTRIVLNDAPAMIPDSLCDPDFDLPTEQTIAHIRNASGPDRIEMASATRVATDLLGDAMGANLFMVGYAYQRGLIPVSSGSVLQAIADNGVAVSAGQTAFRLGRLAAADPEHLRRLAPGLDAPAKAEALDEIVSRRTRFLTEYQNAQYAGRYRAFVARVADAETRAMGDNGRLATAVARYLFKLMAYKDEYEVARLYTDVAFRQRLSKAFDGGGRVSFYMAPSFLPLRRGVDGQPIKIRLGGWMFKALSLLSALRFLRGTPFDPFGYLPEHRMERAMIEKYMARVEEALPLLAAGNIERVIRFCEGPEVVRGFGHVKRKSILKLGASFEQRILEGT